MLLHYGAVCEQGAQEGTEPLVQLSASFQSCPPLPTSKLGPSGADSWVGGFAYILGPCVSLQWTLLWGWDFLLPPQPPHIFSVRGFEALFPHAVTLGCVVFLAPQLFLLVYPHTNVGPLVNWLLSSHTSSPYWLPIFDPPASLDKCFFFNSLVVRLPYSLIFWQFWFLAGSQKIVSLKLHSMDCSKFRSFAKSI